MVSSRSTCTYTADLQHRAIEVALAVTSGAYQTSLLSYFIQRDLFQAIINVGAPYFQHFMASELC